jgi:hypothetical protein
VEFKDVGACVHTGAAQQLVDTQASEHAELAAPLGVGEDNLLECGSVGRLGGGTQQDAEGRSRDIRPTVEAVAQGDGLPFGVELAIAGAGRAEESGDKLEAGAASLTPLGLGGYIRN